MKRVLVCAAATAVCTVSLSQPAEPAQEPCISQQPDHHSWPSSISHTSPDSEVANLAVIADPDENLTGDVIWVRDGTAVIAVKPAAYVGAILPVKASGVSLEYVTGLALSPSDGGDVGEGFYAANDAGLSFWWLPTTAADPGAFSKLTVESSLWINATHLHTADLDGGQGRDDVFGINEAENKVLIVRHDGQSHGSTQQLSVPSGVILDVTSVDWYHNGVRHIAVLYTNGLVIINPTTPSVQATFTVPSGGVITTLTLPNGNEVVAWAGWSTSLSKVVLVLKGSGGLSFGPLELDLEDCQQGTTNVQPFAMEALDYDHQPGDDLLLALPDERIAVLKYQSGTYFSTSELAYDIATVGAAYGLPGVGQLDDGPDDIALPGLDGNLYIFNKLPYEYALENGPPTSADILHENCEWGLPFTGAEEEDRQLNMAFTVPQGYGYATHIEVILWHLPDPSTSEVLSGSAAAVHHRVYQLEESEPNQWIALLDMADGSCWPTAQGQDHYFPEFRFVQYVNGTITQASRVFSGGFTLRIFCDAEEFEHEVDDVFLDDLIEEQTGSAYDYGVGIPILNQSFLSTGVINTGAVHGLFHPSAKPPMNPGNLPPPGAITVSSAGATGFE